jgi:sulfide dehydrogenase cytochrome subunit
MKRVQALPILLLLALGLPGIASAEPAAAYGTALANACAACHGPDGQSQGAIPALNRLTAAEIVTALQAYRAEQRPGTVMPRIAKGLDDAAIQAVAAYLATLSKH